jgi:hypothetical protein
MGIIILFLLRSLTFPNSFQDDNVKNNGQTCWGRCGRDRLVVRLTITYASLIF